MFQICEQCLKRKEKILKEYLKERREFELKFERNHSNIFCPPPIPKLDFCENCPYLKNNDVVNRFCTCGAQGIHVWRLHPLLKNQWQDAVVEARSGQKPVAHYS